MHVCVYAADPDFWLDPKWTGKREVCFASYFVYRFVYACLCLHVSFFCVYLCEFSMSMHIYIYIYIYILFVRVCVCIYVCIHACVCVCVCVTICACFLLMTRYLVSGD